MPETSQLQQVLIVGLTPDLLGKPAFWFPQNEKQINKALSTSIFWRQHALHLETGAKASLPELLRRLDEFGYEKVQDVGAYGEFAVRGGMVDIFPLNLERPIRIEFLGNRIEEVVALPQESELTRKQFAKRIKARKDQDLGDLRPGEYVVHLDHGVGRYIGKQTLPAYGSPTSIDSGGRTSEYYALEYATGDKLYVPTELTGKLSRYVGFAEPTVHRLGGELWLKTKRKIKEDALNFAKELLKLYAAREVAQRPPYLPDDTMQQSFEDAFGFEETPDQIKAVAEIKRDMAKPYPMDRLVCGDVGFGKTEVAFRAAFKAALSGKQVALLTPTTILADQHFHTAKKRMEPFGVETALLTRLQKNAEARSIIHGITTGSIDVVIGTHRILSRDVAFKNLGLLIVDEEQRFGVKQKERLRKLRSNLDVLSLSATPIPRTLSFAVTGLRPISRIQTPPPNRQTIRTFILPWRSETVRKAIREELKRDGQVYLLHNRIQTMEAFVQELKHILPHCRIGMIHGRMDEKELLETMRTFREGTIDVLVATTIIENGLDIERVNTLIVEDAAKLGLAQAYQIRGRIGRSHVQAYAYFFYRKRSLKGRAKERLRALKEAEALGSGYRLALRDLEIRGAGNLLGKEQSGNVNKVGLNLYCQMLSEAVEQLHQEKSPA